MFFRQESRFFVFLLQKKARKHSKEKKELSAKKQCSGKVLINSFIYKKKSNLQKNPEKNISESIDFRLARERFFCGIGEYA